MKKALVNLDVARGAFDADLRPIKTGEVVEVLSEYTFGDEAWAKVRLSPRRTTNLPFKHLTVLTGGTGEYYHDLDLKTNLWCVFHTEHAKAVASFADEGQAKEEADKRNRPGDK